MECLPLCNISLVIALSVCPYRFLLLQQYQLNLQRSCLRSASIISIAQLQNNHCDSNIPSSEAETEVKALRRKSYGYKDTDTGRTSPIGAIESTIMATYKPPSFPRKPSPKNSNVVSDLQYQLRLLYYRYEINTGQYVMSSGEKFAYNFVFFSFVALLLSAVYYYLPSAMYMSGHRLGYYFTGSNKLDVARMSAASAEVLRSNDAEAVRSLAEHGQRINASAGFAP